jgi:hypothetical protein
MTKNYIVPDENRRLEHIAANVCYRLLIHLQRKIFESVKNHIKAEVCDDNKLASGMEKTNLRMIENDRKNWRK